MVRCRRIILQDAAVYLHLKKENNYINTKSNSTRDNPFATAEFAKFQQEVIAAINSPSTDRLQEYEELVPSLVDSQKEVVARMTENHIRLLHGQHQQNERLDRIENSLDRTGDQQNRSNSLLAQLIRDQQILMLQHQCLSSQMQLLMATSAQSSAPSGSLGIPLPLLSQNNQTSSFAAPPSVSLPSLVPGPPLAPNPNQMQPQIAAPPAPNLKPKAKKKAKWVIYEPNCSK